ncbi:MAG: FAD-dependent oxidoreductase [Tsuneonella sp.]
MPDERVDVVVLGTGAAGLTAALAAHAGGAKVALLERGERVGGTSAVSGGVIWTAGNPRQRAAGMDDSREEALAYFRSLDHGDLVDETLEAFVDRAPEALAFLESEGALSVSLLPGYPDYYLDRPGAKAAGGRAMDHDLFCFGELGNWATRVLGYDDPRPMMLRETPLGGATDPVPPAEIQRRVAADERGFGQAMVGRLLKACLERGIEPQFGVRVERLLNENGRMNGVIGTRDGEPFELRADAVVLATGGFEWDADLRQAFLRGPVDAPASPPTARGEGLRLAMRAGARLGNMTSAWWAPTLAPPGNRWDGGEQRASPLLIERTVPHSIMVNRQGKRFCNEAANYSALAGAFHRFDPQSYDYENIPAWLVFDGQYRARYPLDTIMPGAELPPEWVVTAETLPDLAAAIDVPPDALEDTVVRFNDDAARGEDREFGRGTSAYDHFYGDRSRSGTATTLGTLERPPFHAVRVHMGMLGTNGGPQTDGLARVLDLDGKPMPGLYGAGNVIASPTGGIYAGAGGTLGPAIAFGYIAGKAAAGAT